MQSGCWRVAMMLWYFCFVRFQTLADLLRDFHVNYFANGAIYEKKKDEMERVRRVASLSYSYISIHL